MSGGAYRNRNAITSWSELTRGWINGMVSSQQRRMSAAIANLLEWVGDGRRLSELPPDRKGILNYCIKYGYVDTYPLRRDTLINATGRRP